MYIVYRERPPPPVALEKRLTPVETTLSGAASSKHDRDNGGGSSSSQPGFGPSSTSTDMSFITSSSVSPGILSASASRSGGKQLEET